MTLKQHQRAYPPRGRVLNTPTHTTWLNQHELVLRGIDDCYMQLSSLPAHSAMIVRLLKGCEGYNHLLAQLVE